MAKQSIKAWGVRIDHHLNFKANAEAASPVTQKLSKLLWRITTEKVTSPAVPHHLATSIPITAMMWGSEIWWTGAAHILFQLNPAYNTIVRIITGLPKWTPIKFLLAEAYLLPLDLLLTQAAQSYAVRIL